MQKKKYFMKSLEEVDYSLCDPGTLSSEFGGKN